jgi:hypothetical protein
MLPMPKTVTIHNCLEFMAKSKILARQRETHHAQEVLGSTLMIAIAVAAVSADISTSIPRASAQAPANSAAPPAPALKTP